MILAVETTGNPQQLRKLWQGNEKNKTIDQVLGEG
jgi:hypothetical protein